MEWDTSHVTNNNHKHLDMEQNMKMDYGFRFSFIVYNASFIKNKGKQLKYNKMT